MLTTTRWFLVLGASCFGLIPLMLSASAQTPPSTLLPPQPRDSSPSTLLEPTPVESPPTIDRPNSPMDIPSTESSSSPSLPSQAESVPEKASEPASSPETVSAPETAPESDESAKKPGSPPIILDPTSTEPLNPNPDPLATPTKPEEVKIQTIQAITLQQALQLALRNSPTLKVSEQTILRSQDLLKQARAAYFPTLDLQSSYTHQQSFVLNPPEPRFSIPSALSGDAANQLSNTLSLVRSGSFNNSTDIFSTSASLNYDFYTSGLRKAQNQAAEQQIEANRLALGRDTQDLFLNVTLAYYTLQNADELIRINQAAVTNAEKSLKDTQAQERAGLGTRFDVLQSQVQLANAVQALTDARSQQQTAQRQLAQLLNIANQYNLVTAEPVAIAGMWDLTLEESLVRAFQERVELKQVLAQRQVSEQQQIAALAAVKPQVGVTTGYSVSNNFVRDNSLTTAFSIAATVRWRAFDGGAAKANASAFSRDVVAAERQYENIRTQIRLAVEQSYFTLRSNFESIQTATLSVDQAQEALRLSRLRFQAGVGTQTDVINSETALTRAQGNKVNAILGYNRALAQLRRSLNSLSANASTPKPS